MHTYLNELKCNFAYDLSTFTNDYLLVDPSALFSAIQSTTDEVFVPEKITE